MTDNTSERAAPRPLFSDEQIKSEAERWHDNDTISDETCEHRALEILAFAAGARWAAEKYDAAINAGNPDQRNEA